MIQIKNLKFKTENFNSGFTLVELIVVVTVLAILSSIGIASFVESSRNAELQTVQDKMTTMLSVAKSRSLSQTSPTTGCNDSLQGYGVLLLKNEENNTEMCLYAVCKGGPISNSPLDCEDTIETYLFPVGISIENDPFPGPFYFPILSGSIEGLTNSVQIDITGYGKTKSITVNANGVISTGLTPTPSE